VKNMGKENNKFEDRRRHKRFSVEKSIEYQFVFNSEVSDLYKVDSKNISQAGLLIESKKEVPIGAVIAVELDNDLLLGHIDVLKLQSYITIDLADKKIARICGKVVRVETLSSGTYHIGIHFINK